MNFINRKINIVPYAIIFGLVFITIFFFNSTSPLHSIMNLPYDQVLYDLVGKGMLVEKVPYIDLIDHKGIYLFSIFAFANLICATNHIGLFIVSFIFYFVNAIFIYKISKLLLININSKYNFSNKDTSNNIVFAKAKTENEGNYHTGYLDNRLNRGAHKLIDIFSIITSYVLTCVLSSIYFSIDGLDCETIIILFLSISYYYFLKYLLSIKDTYKTHDVRLIFLQGILAGIIIFIKANGAFPFVAIAIVLLIIFIKNKDYKGLGLNILFGLLGLIVSFLPGIIYCVINGCFDEMIYNSFIVNILYTKTGLPGLNTLSESLILTFSSFKVFMALSIFSIFIFIYFEKNIIVILYNILFGLINIYISVMPLRPYTHYMIFYLISYIPLSLFFLISIYNLFLSNANKISRIIVLISLFIIMNIFSYNYCLDQALMTGSINTSTSKKVKNVMEKALGRKLNVKLDRVFIVSDNLYTYEYLNIMPTHPYFALPIIDRSDYSLPYDKIIEYARSGFDNFFIVYNDEQNLTDDYKKFNAELKLALNEKYDYIDSAKGMIDYLDVYMLRE